MKHILCSDAASRWAGRAFAHLEFGSSVNPITTRRADYAHHTTASPPGFEDPGAWLLCKYTNWGVFNIIKYLNFFDLTHIRG